MLVDVFLVVGDDGFGNRLADGVHLGRVSSAGDADADVDVGWYALVCSSRCLNGCFEVLGPGKRAGRTEFVKSEHEDGLVDLEAQDLGLDERERLAVDLDESFTGLAILISILFSSYPFAIPFHICAIVVSVWAVGMYLAVSDSCNDMLAIAIPGWRRGQRQRTSRGLLLAEALHALRGHVGD